MEKTFASLNQAELVFTGKVTKVSNGAVGYTDPPSFSDDLTFKVLSVLGRGKVATTTFVRNVSQPEVPQYPKDVTWLVAADKYGGHWGIRLIVPADEKILALAKQAVSLPLGWKFENGRPVSPWAVLGDKTWPKDGPVSQGPVCSKSSRPALFAGNGIELTAAQVLPAHRHEFRNPYGDGQFKISVTNRSGKPAVVPALLTDGKTIFWEDSLLVLVITDGSGPHLLRGAGRARNVQPVALKAGESVSATIDVLPLDGVSWPRGGWRMYFRFCLGEMSAIDFFYYHSDHHDALRNEVLKRLQVQLPSADVQTTVDKLNLGPAKLYVHWTGKAKDFRFLKKNAGYYTAEDFSFTFLTDDHGTWPLISREPTPFETWRFGTTYTGLAVDWKSEPKVRVVGVKTIDRQPATFHDAKLDPDKIITALIVEVWKDKRWQPWFINNWFHKWGSPADSALIVSHYVDRPSPAFDVYGFKGDISAELTERSRKLVEKYPSWRAYHGRIVRDPQGKHGWALELVHAFVPNKTSGGHDAVIGDPKDLILLSLEKTRWPMLYGGAHHPNAAEEELPPPLKVRWKFRGKEGFAGSPVVAGGRVFCGNNDKHLYCVEARTGKKLWAFATGDLVESTPAVVDNQVLFGSFDGKVYCLDVNTGTKRWEFATGPRIAGFTGIDDVKQGVDSSIAVVDGRVYFGAWDGKMYCLDLASGKKLWEAQTKGPVHFCSPALAQDRVFLGSADGSFHAWDAKSGALLWEKTLCDKHADHMMCSPAVHDGVVFTGSGYNGIVYALSAAKGEPIWQYSMKNLVCGTMVVHQGKVFVFGDGGGQLLCLDAKRGTRIWETMLGKGWGAGAPLVSGKYLYVTMREGSVDKKPADIVALEAATGQVVWYLTLGKAWGTCVIVDGVLYFGSDDGHVYALESKGS